jgi:hypothetical protein
VEITGTIRRCCALSRRRPGRASIGLKLASCKLKALTGQRHGLRQGAVPEPGERGHQEQAGGADEQHAGAARVRVCVFEVQQKDGGPRAPHLQVAAATPDLNSKLIEC